MAGGRGGKVPPRAGRRRDEAEVALERGAGAAPRVSGEPLTRATGRSAAGLPAVAPGRSSAVEAGRSAAVAAGRSAAVATGRSAAGAAGRSAAAPGRSAAVAPGRSAAGAAGRSAAGAAGRSAAGAAGLAAVTASRGPRRRSPWRSTARAADLASVSRPRAHPTSQLPSAGPRCSRSLLPRGKAKPIPSATTMSSLSDDELREIFLRLPNLRALLRAALTCRAWLRAARSSRPFRRLFLALHPAPLIGIFTTPFKDETPVFYPLRRLSDPDASAVLRGGDFFLTSLPLDDDYPEGWSLRGSQDGYLLLSSSWGRVIAAVNPVTRAADILPWLPFGCIRFHPPVLLCSDEHPRSFRCVCLCLLQWSKLGAAVFSSETSGWVVHPSVHLSSGSDSFNDGTLVNGSVYWPVDREHRMVRLDTSTMNISFMDLPLEVKVNSHNFRAGDTKDGQLCIVYVSDFVLHVWIRGVDRDGIEIWVTHSISDLDPEINGINGLTDGITDYSEGDLEVVEVRSGYVYSTFQGWFFSLSLETMMLELLISASPSGRFDADPAHLYFMAWPRSLVGDDGSTGYGVESSH